MDLNFEGFSFDRKDIFDQIEHLSQSEKVEFLIGHIKELEDHNAKRDECLKAICQIIISHQTNFQEISKLFKAAGVELPKLNEVKIEGNTITWGK